MPFNYAADGGNAATSVTRVNGSPVNDSLAARQLYARHLYVLMMALADNNALKADYLMENRTSSRRQADGVARMIAQWAVNVVGYRDHNDIMIPFPYDPNPFSGNNWNPPNDVQHTVWSCKRPALLMTETMALHDRRTQDLNDEVVDSRKVALGASKTRVNPGLTTDTDAKKKDPTFNSKYRPQGSLFVELYNPWTLLEPRTADLGPANPTAAGNGVQLNKITPAVNGRSSPVWRLVIVVPTPAPPKTLTAQPNGDELPDPDNPIVGNRPAIERAAYFVNVSGLNYPTADGQAIYYPSANSPSPLVVAPAGYAVVGSGDINQQNRTYIGFETGKGAGNPASTRMITLNPADLADARVVRNTGDLSASRAPSRRSWPSISPNG